MSGCGGGTSTAGSTGTTGTSAPALTISPGTTLTFPSTTVGQTSAAQSFTLTNTGNATLTLTSYTVAGATSSFTESSASTCSASTISLAANTSCTLVFNFSPQTTGPLTETISATDNAATPAVSLTLTGTGASSSVATAALSPATVVFPSTPAAGTSAAQTVTLSNTGTGPLSVTLPAVLGGANPGAFSIFGTSCSASLAAGSSCTFNVTFTPPAAGTTYNATLSVTDNSGGGSTQTVALTGFGAAALPVALAVLSPTSLTFASTTVGNSATAQTISLSNPGTATLTGIAVSVTGAAFSETTTCGTTLAAAANCTISVGFKPVATGSAGGTLSVADSATGSPQTVALSGTGAAPMASLSGTSIAFPTTLIATTSAAQTVSLTNTGTAPLTGLVISLGGANAGNFAETTTCGTTLAAGANCSISATFSPSGATNYSASISVASSATSTPQTITLSGYGSTTAVTRTLYTFPESDNSATVLYNFINSATRTIDMTMYEMQDTTFTADLVAACARGVVVRVIFSSSEATANKPALTAINAGGANCQAVESNSAFVNTHQKTITIDGGYATQQTAILSLNLQTQYYSTTRDFALIENDAADISAIEATFNQDYAAGGTNSASDFTYQPGGGDASVYPAGDLIWSPTTAQPDMLSIINNATKTLLVENEEMSASNIVSALESACQRGVNVHITMVASSSYTSNFNALTAAGCGLYLYPSTTTGFYVHAKAVVADYGLPTQNAYMGSINYSTTSMLQNRELGLFISDPAAVQILYTVLSQDYTGNPSY